MRRGSGRTLGIRKERGPRPRAPIPTTRSGAKDRGCGAALADHTLHAATPCVPIAAMTARTEPWQPIVGVILAGGLSRRMGGGDKCLLPLGGRPLLAHVIERLMPAVGALVLNANGDPARFAGFGLPVVADTAPGFAGPLAGILAGMQWTIAHRPDVPAIVTAAGDTPFFPRDLVPRLVEAATGPTIAIARSDGRVHPVFGVFPVAYANGLESFIKTSASFGVTDWLAGQRTVAVDFVADADIPLDPFFNVNTPADLAAAGGALAALPLQFH
jgi:molybdopterin-guanine dinucleotide biosynthesis protein A